VSTSSPTDPTLRPARPDREAGPEPQRQARNRPTGRVRRFDPHRRERILDAAIEVIAAHGVAGTTHRVIAAAADVSLGSLTYYFSSLEDLRAQAFSRLADRVTGVYEAHFGGVHTSEDFIEAVTNLVHDAVGVDAAEWVVTYELYLAALRDPALRSVTESWMRASRSVLERFVDPDVARSLDALIEGLIMHRTLATAPATRAQTQAAIIRAIAPLPG
jgi:TetR/AcrR family transcriptional regulator, regulator of biofilm formation and stress response